MVPETVGGGVVCRDFWVKLVRGIEADLERVGCTELSWDDCVELDRDLNLKCEGTAVAGTSVVA